MPHPIVHAEIRSTDPDATRKFFADLLGWTSRTQARSPAIPSWTRCSRRAVHRDQ